ncbi:MAG: ATP-binding protein [Deinococcales bacterium]
MRLRTQLMLVVTLVALAAVTITALLSVQVATRRVGRLLDMPVTTQDASHTPAARGTGPGMMGGSGATPAGAGPAFAEARRQALRSDLWRANLQAAGIALLVAAAVAAALSARLSGPLRNLTAVTNRYAAGERAARAREGGRNEVAEVAQAFNRMADSLQREEDEQQRLIADIAHELRTPLTVLKGELEALEDGLLEAEPATYRRLGEEVTLLERLVQDLRLLTMAESGELTLHRRPVDLAVLVREVTASFAPHAGGSRVDVTLRTDAGTAELGVRDRGPGIPEEERERVFQRFYRLDRARSRATGGSGLGLAIVRTLVELHEGSVAAASHPEGGALLVVRLPLSA